ncbi:hypothetical protein GQ457_10G002800 [Hibiscus cannabinus]
MAKICRMYNRGCNFSSPRESLLEKVKSSMCCFRLAAAQIEDGAGFHPLEEAKSSRTPYIREKCRNLTAWIGKGGGHLKHHGSSDFSYDPMSYALNFEDESSRADEVPFVSFSSRLPATPERPAEIKHLSEAPVPVRMEVYAFS